MCRYIYSVPPMQNTYRYIEPKRPKTMYMHIERCQRRIDQQADLHPYPYIYSRRMPSIHVLVHRIISQALSVPVHRKPERLPCRRGFGRRTAYVPAHRPLCHAPAPVPMACRLPRGGARGPDGFRGGISGTNMYRHVGSAGRRRSKWDPSLSTCRYIFVSRPPARPPYGARPRGRAGGRTDAGSKCRHIDTGPPGRCL